VYLFHTTGSITLHYITTLDRSETEYIVMCCRKGVRRACYWWQ